MMKGVIYRCLVWLLVVAANVPAQLAASDSVTLGIFGYRPDNVINERYQPAGRLPDPGNRHGSEPEGFQSG